MLSRQKLVIVVVILLLAKVGSGAWAVETVAILSDTCRGLGLCLDSNNKPHIVYAQKHTGFGEYAWEKYKDASGIWQGPYNACPHSEAMVAHGGPWNCVALASKNDTFWVVTLYSRMADHLSCLYASYKDGIGGAWSAFETVRSWQGTFPARFPSCDIAVESGRVVHLVYTDHNDTTTYYRKRTGAGWSSDEKIGDAEKNVFWYYYKPSIELEGTTPHIAGWFHNDDPSVPDILPSYRNKVAGSWGSKIRMSNWGFWPNRGGGYVSLALNPLGNNYDMACWGNPEGDRIVRFGQRVVDGWTGNPAITPVDMGSGDFCADIVGYANKAFLAYKNNAGDLKFARYDALLPPTTTQLVDDAPTNVGYVCLKIGSDGSVHIAYYAEESGYKIKYAYNPGIGIEEDRKSEISSLKLTLYPNPFSRQTKICFDIEQSAEAEGINTLGTTALGPSIKIYDATGRLIKDFSRFTNYDICPTIIVWQGDNELGRSVGAGVYFVWLEYGRYKTVEKVVLLR